MLVDARGVPSPLPAAAVACSRPRAGGLGGVTPPWGGGKAAGSGCGSPGCAAVLPPLPPCSPLRTLCICPACTRCPPSPSGPPGTPWPPPRWVCAPPPAMLPVQGGLPRLPSCRSPLLPPRCGAEQDHGVGEGGPRWSPQHRTGVAAKRGDSSCPSRDRHRGFTPPTGPQPVPPSYPRGPARRWVLRGAPSCPPGFARIPPPLLWGKRRAGGGLSERGLTRVAPRLRPHPAPRLSLGTSASAAPAAPSPGCPPPPPPPPGCPAEGSCPPLPPRPPHGSSALAAGPAGPPRQAASAQGRG